MFTVLIGASAQQFLQKLNPVQRNRIILKVEQILSTAPFPRAKNPKKLSGMSGYRLRVGDYRILYTVEQQLVKIYKIGHRKDVYS